MKITKITRRYIVSVQARLNHLKVAHICASLTTVQCNISQTTRHYCKERKRLDNLTEGRKENDFVTIYKLSSREITRTVYNFRVVPYSLTLDNFTSEFIASSFSFSVTRRANRGTKGERITLHGTAFSPFFVYLSPLQFHSQFIGITGRVPFLRESIVSMKYPRNARGNIRGRTGYQLSLYSHFDFAVKNVIEVKLILYNCIKKESL